MPEKRRKHRLVWLAVPGAMVVLLMLALVGAPSTRTYSAPPGVPLTWGNNERGQLGDGTLTNRPDPEPVPPLSNIIAIAGGGRHSLALSADGTVYAWGANDTGQLGDGTTTERDQPVKVPGLAGIVAIAAGSSHSLALDASGQVWSWGDDSHGQLGDGSRMPFDTRPQPVPGLSGITQIAAGDGFSLALDANGQVYGWGDDGYCELAFCGPPFVSTPNPLPVMGARQISAGSHHALALTISGDRVLAWGADDAGQLGNSAGLDPDYPRRATPDFVLDGNGNPLDGIAQVSAGGQHSLAVRRSDGAVYAWGDNSFGQLGDGTLTGRETPDLVQGLTGVFKVAAGGHHSLALGGLEFRNGSQPFVSSIVYGWGLNDSGQAGTHIFDDPLCKCRKLAATVTGGPFASDPLLGVTDIAAGDIHSLAIAASVATLQDELDLLSSIPDAGSDPSCDPGACPPPPCSGPTCPPPPTMTSTATPCIPILTLISSTPILVSGRLDAAAGSAGGHGGIQKKPPVCPSPTGTATPSPTSTPCVPTPGAVSCQTPTPTATPCVPLVVPCQPTPTPSPTPCVAPAGQVCQPTPTPMRTPTPCPTTIIRARIDSVDKGVGQRQPPPPSVQPTQPSGPNNPFPPFSGPGC